MFNLTKTLNLARNHPFYAVEEQIQRIRETIIGDNEVFVGFRHKLGVGDVEEMPTSRLRREVLTMPLPPTGELNNVLITGQAGSGKTQLAFSTVVDNYIRRFGDRCNTFIIDPSGEYSVIHKVLPESSNAMRIWGVLGMTPQYDLSPRIYNPYACADPDDKIGTYKINIENITLDDLITICDVKSGREEDERQVDMLTEAVYHWYHEKGIEDPPADPLCPPFNELMEVIIRNKLGGRVLRRTLMNLRNQGFVGNESQYPPPPVVQNLYRHDGHPSIQVLHTSTDEFLSRRMAGLVQVELKKLIAEQRRRYEAIKDGHHVSHIPLHIVVDEYQRVYRTQFYKNIYDTCGKFLTFITGILPSLVDLPDNTPIRQANYLICARIAPSEERGVKEILGKLIDPTILSELEDPGKGRYPKQFALIKKERTISEDMEANNIITFYPSLTITRIVKRRSVTATYHPPEEVQTSLVEDYGVGVEIKDVDDVIDEGDDDIITPEEAEILAETTKPIINPPGEEPDEEKIPPGKILAPKVQRELTQYYNMSARQSEIFDEFRYQLEFFRKNKDVYVSYATIGRNIGVKAKSVKSAITTLKGKGYIQGNMIRGWVVLKDEFGKDLTPPREYKW